VLHLRKRRTGVLAIGCALLSVLAVGVPVAKAQQSSGIAGAVRDAEGLPMPGVTVEAASPALIEKVRSAITDGEGRYNIVDLRPGSYTVTFSLPGFATVRREGITLGSGFTATVNVQMQVGGLEETITVSGAAPVVDTQTMRRQERLDQQELESLPSGNIGLQTLAYMTPGFATTQADVGGGRDTWSAQGAYQFYHGKDGTRASFDGFRNQYFIGAASGVGYISDQGVIGEMQLETSGMGAESGSGSISLNIIPKSGSNNFNTTIDGFYSNKGMQGANLGSSLDEWAQGNEALLNAAGIRTAAEVQRIYRVGAQLGGPIMQDKLWFFAAVGRWGSRVNQPNAYFNTLQGTANIPGCGQAGAPSCASLGGVLLGPTPTLFYPGQPGTPFQNLAPSANNARPAASFDWYRNHAVRTTWNVNQKNRVNFFVDIQKSCRCTTGPFTGANSIESERGWDWWPSGVVQGTWTAPLTSRLLLEAGGSWQVANWVNFAETGVSRDDRSILELATGYRYGATTLLTAPKARTGRSAQRFSLSYVTGTHNFKGGVTLEQAFNDESADRNNSACSLSNDSTLCDGLNYNFLNGRPAQLEYYALPSFQQERMNAELGLFVQDQWKIRRLTLNLGIRYDWVTMGFPDATLPAGPWVPERSVTGISGVPDWRDINPRFGFAYDVFGNGRTAVKASIGRYLELSRSDMTRRFHPFTSSVRTANRSWNDANGNYIPDCVLNNFTANGECGAISNVNFGRFLPAATQYSDAVLYDNRNFLWDINTEIVHEVVQGMSVSFVYNRNWDGNFTVMDNLAVGPGDFDEYCVNIPNDSRLPNAGQRQCGYYDVKPQFFGQGVNRVINTKELPGNQKPQRYWDGITLTVNGRLPRGITLGGGIDAGKQVRDNCITVDAPNIPRSLTGAANAGGPFCRSVTSFKDNMDIRIRASVPLKWGINASAIFRNTAGALRDATWQVNNADIAAGRVQFLNGRTAFAGNVPQAVALHAPFEIFGPRFNQLDVAVNKNFETGIGRLRLAFDVYNALNSNSIQGVTTAYTNSALNRWLRPTLFMDARLARVTASLSF
jgi:hypothetical protein